MTTSVKLPFVCRFAEALPADEAPPLRYDPIRHVSQVCLEGVWVDAVDAGGDLFGNTRKTAVVSETTDDR